MTHGLYLLVGLKQANWSKVSIPTPAKDNQTQQKHIDIVLHNKNTETLVFIAL